MGGTCGPPHANNVSIYVNANEFRAFGGSGIITPAAAGQLCLNVTGYLISPGKVAGERFHPHGGTALVPDVIAGHLIYGTGLVLELILLVFQHQIRQLIPVII
jgi:hypothetical protein